jgi:hypothetical protein
MKSAFNFNTRYSGYKISDRRNQRTFAPRNARSSRTNIGKAQPRSASVCGTAAIIALRLRSSRLSACAPLFRSPNRQPTRHNSDVLINTHLRRVETKEFVQQPVALLRSRPRRPILPQAVAN